MKNAHEELTLLALDLTLGVSSQERFQRLLITIRKLFKCDASALLAFTEQQFSPLAIDGLAEEVLGRRFSIEDHPRLEAIARAGDIVRFPADSHLADPYDGLIPNHEGELQVHSCIGLPLLANDRLIGALTIDAFDPTAFDSFSNKELRIINALAAASLYTSLLIQKIENQVDMIPQSQLLNNSDKNNNVEMIGNSTAMAEVHEQIKAVANTDLSVLITGETGVGKELVAASIHAQSSRNKETLVYLNCAALPETVAESELFGHVKGAFTGAISHRQGKFELADNGTLFLDEVGELPLSLQAKLLRVLQYGDLQRVGDDRSLKVNTRIVAATNRALHEEVKSGRFRADLYHRLSVFPIHIPPLRERDKDVILLAGFFAEKSKNKLAVATISISQEAINLFLSYTWPGNIRELEHAINRAAVIAKSQSTSAYIVLQPEHFNISEQQNKTTVQHHTGSSATNLQLNSGLSLREATDALQTTMLKQAYQENNHNWAAAARQLKIDTGNLHRLAKRLNLK
ncbi:nitric oxide reductase transcriptional regulator NorR [Psychromonas sp.]|uniref:nitric oxide reductase transcriptional regulator NorR n=1 Tax=Psychromonas sp. TaxID=1884585 RepID=UPI0035682B49